MGSNPMVEGTASLILAIALSFLLLPVTVNLLDRQGMLVKNFRGEWVVQGGGVFLIALILVVVILLRPYGWGLFLGVVIPFGFAGLWDDLKGDHTSKGFKGHFSALMEGRLTSGMVKLLVGGAAALVGSFVAGRGLLTAAVIALAANLINLVDIRPGRALKVFLLMAFISLPLGGWQGLPFISPMLAGAFFLLPVDMTRRVILGDAGANFLGAGLGYQWGFYLSEQGILLLFVTLALLHLFSEWISFSKVIERFAILRWLDLLGRWKEN